MKVRLGDKIRLMHILDAIGEMETYLQDCSYQQFMDSSEKRFATIKQLEIVGKACNAISDEVKSSNPLFP